MKLLLIVNATASSVTEDARYIVEKALMAEHDLEVVETNHRHHATELAAQAVEDNFDVVVVLAGDGTLNDAAQALVNSPTALGPLPGGSTSVFARTLGYPRDFVQASAQLLHALDQQQIQRIGVGKISRDDHPDRFFLFAAGIGLDAEVIRKVERKREKDRGKSKTRSEFAAQTQMLMSAAATLARRYKGADLAVETAGERIDGLRFVVVTNSNPWTYLGNRPVCLNADAGLGSRLAMTGFHDLRLRTLFGAGFSGMRKMRRLHNDPQISQRSDLGSIHVLADAPTPVQVDGDDLGDADELTLSYVPNALRVVCPNLTVA